jgi:hypothetical protein
MQSTNKLSAEISALRAELQKMTAELNKSEKALSAFASHVFNDNGDMTVNRCTPDAEEFIAAYFAAKSARAALGSVRRKE